jgi:hypothetical protein
VGQTVSQASTFSGQAAGNVWQSRRQPERDKLKQLALPPPLDLFG